MDGWQPAVQPSWYRNDRHRRQFEELLGRMEGHLSEMVHYRAACYLLALLTDQGRIAKCVDRDKLRLHQLLIGDLPPEEQATVHLSQALFTDSRADLAKCCSLLDDDGIHALLEAISLRYCGQALQDVVSSNSSPGSVVDQIGQDYSNQQVL